MTPPHLSPLSIADPHRACGRGCGGGSGWAPSIRALAASVALTLGGPAGWSVAAAADVSGARAAPVHSTAKAGSQAKAKAAPARKATPGRAGGAATKTGSRNPGKTSRAALPATSHPAALAATRRAAAGSTPLAAKRNIAVGDAAVPAAPKALLSHGCLDGAHGEWLIRVLGNADDAALRPVRLQSESAADCVPFASVRTPGRQIEAMAWIPATLAEVAAAGGPRAAMLARPDLPQSARWFELFAPLAERSELWAPAVALLSGEWPEGLPTRWQREVAVLVRQMKRLSGADDTALVRMVLDGPGDAARLAAVELIDATGDAIDSAVWLDRDGGPGGFVSASGGDHERMLWQSPVDYRRISRGVGSYAFTARQRVLAPSHGGKPRFVVRSFRAHGQHQGIDFAAPTGTPVVTVADGTVLHAALHGGYGNLVIVDHGGGITTYYAHLSAYGEGVQEGAVVQRGQEVGLVGSTGRSTGPHLHFEIRKDGRYLDPADPQQSLPNWALAPSEHEAVLSRLLALSVSRRDAFSGATRDGTPRLPRSGVKFTLLRPAESQAGTQTAE